MYRCILNFMNIENNCPDLSNLIDYIYEHPRNITYVAIGCANVRYPDKIPPPQDRQQYPLFLEEFIKNNNESARIILIDPYLEIIPSIFYFFKSVFSVDPFDNIYHCEPLNVEVIVIRKPVQYQHPLLSYTEMTFFELLNVHIIEKKGILLVQDFTGTNISVLQEYFYNRLHPSLRNQYVKKILYDFTYGSDKGCIFDLTSPDNSPVIKKKILVLIQK